MSGTVDGLGLGPLTQLAWVVTDLEAAEQQIAAVYGSTPWTRLPGIAFGPVDCSYRGAPADFVADISLAYRGDLQLELISPVGGESIYTEFLAANRSGLHHVCFEVADDSSIEDVLARAADRGIACVQQGSMAAGGIEFAYLDLSAAGAAYVEIARTSADMRAFFEAIRTS